MKFFKVTCLLLLVMFVNLTCKKENNVPSSLPPVTQTGANTFGCKVNGQIWVPYFKCTGFSNACGQLQTTFTPVDKAAFVPFIFGLGAQRKTEHNYGSFTVSNLYSALRQSGNVFDSLSIQFSNNAGTYSSFGYQNLYQNPNDNFIITRLDTIHKIMSGTFSFILRNGSDSVVVTDGRFDFSITNFCQCSPD